MAADVTPTPASVSTIATMAEDTETLRIAEIGFQSISTAVALGVTSTALWLFNLPFIQKTVYSTPFQVTTTFNSTLPTQYTVNKVVSSAPIVLKSFTQYEIVNTTNITVFGSVNTASLAPMDAVAWTVAVVADSVA